MQYTKRLKKNFIEKVHMVLDVIIASGAFLAAYGVKKYLLPGTYGGLSTSPNYYIMLAQIVTAWFIAELIFTPYKSFARKKTLRIMCDNLKIVSTVAAVIIILNFLFKIDTSRILIALFMAITLVLLQVSKCFISYLYRRHYSQERNRVRVLIVGTKSRAKQIIDDIQSYKKHYRIIGCLDTQEEQVGTEVKSGVKVIGTPDDIKEIVTANVVDEVLFAMPLAKIDSVDMHILILEMLGIPVRIFPDWYIHSTIFQPGISKIAFDNFGGSPTMLLTATSQNYLNLLMKSVIDKCAAFIILLLLVPLFIVTAVMIKIFSPGPVLFCQKRMGLNGRKFFIYKFRTMVPDAEKKLQELMAMNEADGPAYIVKADE